MTFKEFINKRENIADRTHLERAKNKLPKVTYQKMWFEACDEFKSGLEADLPSHQIINHARKRANLVVSRYLNGAR